MNGSDPMNVTSLTIRNDRMSGAELRTLVPTLPDKCTAHNREGGPCGKDPMLGQSVCYFHGGNSPQAREKASERILDAVMRTQDLFLSRLIERLESPDSELIDTKTLIDGTERMTKLHELLEGRATDRRDTTTSRSEEAWTILEKRLTQLGDKRRGRVAIGGST